MKSYLTGRSNGFNSTPVKDTPKNTGLASVNVLSGKHTAASSSGSCTPEVECIRQGDRVSRIIIHCTCGEEIEINCVYPSAG